jgi:hypothetical protein
MLAARACLGNPVNPAASPAVVRKEQAEPGEGWATSACELPLGQQM